MCGIVGGVAERSVTDILIERIKTSRISWL